MANPEQLAILQQEGVAAWNKWRANAGVALDLSGADFSAIAAGHGYVELDLSYTNLAGTNFSHCSLDECDLTSADLSNAKLRSAKLEKANLTNANLSNTDCTECDLRNADLTAVAVTAGTILTSANLESAKIDPKILKNVPITNARLVSLDLRGLDWSGREIGRVIFQRSNLEGANFSNAKLAETDFHGANVRAGNFKGADLSRANFQQANLTGADLSDANLSGAHLNVTTLDSANIERANFFEANLSYASMQHAKGAPWAKHLLSTRVDQDIRYFPTVIRDWQERWFDWERARLAGQLPLFGASYAGLIAIPIYVYALGIYNDKIEAIRTWLTHVPGDPNSISKATAGAVMAHLRPEPIPESFFILYLSTVCLAIAATIYALACPSRIKSFSRDHWCDELGKPLIHYWPEAWRTRYLRMCCIALYVAGGLGALYVLVTKLLWVGIVLYKSMFPA